MYRRKIDTLGTPGATEAIKEIFKMNIELWQKPDIRSIETAVKDPRLSNWKMYEVNTFVNDMIRQEQLALSSQG